jgi:hypothetical protein
MKTEQATESFLHEASPFIFLIALLGIPAAGAVALVFSLQIPRLAYGEPNPLFAAAEIGSLITVAALLFLLRACLELPSAPRGFYRNLLDFLAMSRWHPAVKAALLGLLVLPPAWYIHGDPGFIPTVRFLGWRSLTSGDVRDDLDRLVTVFQLSLTGGVPLLFVLHMLTRSNPKERILPWLLVPLLFVGAAFGVVVLVMLGHH